MFRAIGDAIWYVITSPARFFRWCCACIGRLRRFLDKRRNHLCAAVIAVMMAIVGIQLRHSGYADLRPGEYVAVEETRTEAKPASAGPSRKSLRAAIRDSLDSIKAKLPSLRRSEGPTAKRISQPTLPEPTLPEPVKVPVVTASQQRSIAPAAPSLKIPAMPKVVEPVSKKRTLILPEPTIVDLSELEEPEEPDVAALSGGIETENDEPESMFGDDK